MAVADMNRTPQDTANPSSCKAEKPILHPVIEKKLYIAQNLVNKNLRDYAVVRTEGILHYDALCDDFGPMNMSCVFQFITLLDEKFALSATTNVLYLVESGTRALTNAIFLLGAYLILKLDRNVDTVVATFSWLDREDICPFRDATFSTPDFDLTLTDCWKALFRGKLNGWVALPSDIPGLWGRIEKDEYDHYDDPLNADLHEVVPGKFVAFKGPKALNGIEYVDDATGYRHFSPEYYLDIFKSMGISTVIRLNEPEYDKAAFTSKDIDHFDLEFADCTPPPSSVVKEFFRIVDSAPGMIAVHCKAGLGRTGTLIALYLMRAHRFTSREAIGWLRIVRPGCVIGQQQHYLCRVEDRLNPAAGREKALSDGSDARQRSAAKMQTTSPAAAAAAAAELASQVAAGMLRRGSTKCR